MKKSSFNNFVKIAPDIGLAFSTFIENLPVDFSPEICSQGIQRFAQSYSAELQSEKAVFALLSNYSFDLFSKKLDELSEGYTLTFNDLE